MEMVNGRKLVVLVLAIMAVSFEGSRVLSLCNISVDELLECKPAATKENPADPTANCCTALQKANLTCLCGYKNSMELPLLGIDPDLAMALPAKCGLTLPDECQ